MSFIKKMQEEARNRMAQQPQRDIDGFAYIRTDIITDELDSIISQVVQNTLNKALELVDKHDPNVGMGRETNKAFWGNTLRADIQSLLKAITSDNK